MGKQPRSVTAALQVGTLAVTSVVLDDMTKGSNQAMQRTAEQACDWVLHLCHRSYSGVARCSGLTVADVVSC